MTPRQLLVLLVAVAAIAGSFALDRYTAYLLHTLAIAATSALALNLLTGFCGQISFAQGALLGIGAYTAGNLGNAGWGLGALLGAGLVTAAASVIIGLPALRLRGLYYAIATLAAQFVLEYLFKTVEPLTDGISGLLISPLTLFGVTLVGDQGYAALAVSVLAITWFVFSRLLRTNLGRAFLVIRENEIVARGMGIDVARTKMWVFLISGFFTGIAGGLLGFTTRLANPEAFHLSLSVDQVAMIIVGGLGSLGGSLIGAVFVVLLPEAIQRVGEAFQIATLLFAMRELAFGLLIILFLVFEPRGLAALLRGASRRLTTLFVRRPAAPVWSMSKPNETGGSSEKVY
jgi:branched-chain amino acid transport system permease protein